MTKVNPNQRQRAVVHTVVHKRRFTNNVHLFLTGALSCVGQIESGKESDTGMVYKWLKMKQPMQTPDCASPLLCQTKRNNLTT